MNSFYQPMTQELAFMYECWCQLKRRAKDSGLLPSHVLLPVSGTPRHSLSSYPSMYYPLLLGVTDIVEKHYYFSV